MLARFGCTDCCCGVGYERDLSLPLPLPLPLPLTQSGTSAIEAPLFPSSSYLSISVDGHQLTDADLDRYDRMTGQIKLDFLSSSASASSSLPTTDSTGSQGVTGTCSTGTDNVDIKARPIECQDASVSRGSSQPLLFGGGIAFPQDVVDGGGHREPWVGFKRSIQQVDLMVAVYENCNCRVV
jgi:hypothetical protein